ncbi:MAG: hypothetical protein H6642_08630 [Caldilineaceae bacterium]|nr:hypothetical protein [Caldilineaceae bacterium]
MIQPPLVRAENFIWNNARLLERRLFAYYFRNGSAHDVLAALGAFQNADGGFGNALEPDIRCPNSQPVPVQHALEILADIDPASPMVEQACDYLLTITTSEGGVPWLLPSAMGYPHAPWWQIEEGTPAALNPTAGIAGILYAMGADHPWLQPAAAYCWARIDDYALQDSLHDVDNILTFLYHAPDRTRAEEHLAHLAQQMLAAGLVADAQADGYVRKPLDWAPTPDHPLRKYLPQADVQAHLDAVLASQQADGGWPINWPPLSPAGEAEWRGWITVKTLRMLDANGALHG